MAVSGIDSVGRSIDQFKSGFFDSDVVIRAMDKATRKAQAGAGAFIRRKAQTSIRKAPKADAATGVIAKGRRKKGAVVVDAVAKPGDPPFGHGDQKLKRLIFFAWDFTTKTTVIGPAKFVNARGGGPEFLEHGGQTVIKNRKGKPRTVSFEGNPFMEPALDAGLTEYLNQFKDSM